MKPLKRLLVTLAVAILPRLYMAYMWLVYKTSRFEHLGCCPDIIRAHYGRGVYALWHDEVFFVAYAFRRWHGHTLASHGDFGEVITKMLRLCNFHVFRGGSSSGKSRRSAGVLEDMIDHMNSNQGVIYGITVDGSKGPAYRMKSGAIRISVACKAPIVVERTWCRRYFRLPTWDRSIIPLPFNRIVHVYAGPYLPPRDANEPGAFERFRRYVENELLGVSDYARVLIEGPGFARKGFEAPRGCEPNGRAPLLMRPFGAIAIDPPRVDEAAGGRSS